MTSMFNRLLKLVFECCFLCYFLENLVLHGAEYNVRPDI